MAKAKAKGESKLKFEQRLVLVRYLIDQFGAKDFDALVHELKADPELEKLDSEGRTRFFAVAAAKLPAGCPLTVETLRAYDENIVRHSRTISRLRGEIVRWKYFQYLALLFAEIYLDRYFQNETGLLADLNEAVGAFNADKPTDERISPYAASDLRKICFWMATGSGKTLIMHVNILQYHHYLRQAKRERELNRVVLLTPNERLSAQHVDELRRSGFSRAQFFEKDTQQKLQMAEETPAVDVIDIHKLEETEGEKTVAIETFESRNLVLIDEGHVGASGDDWMEKRDRLCADGFSFEYSATFGQAMRASKKKELVEKYAKAILFDYSYRYFYSDGYGKNYWILNLGEDGDEEAHKLYLTACLLSFYQQQRLFLDRKIELRPFNIEHPLWVFVGSTVNAVRTVKKEKRSDVVEMLLFFADFVAERNAYVARLKKLLGGKSDILDKNGNDIFASAFSYLGESRATAEQTYQAILSTFFNATAQGTLHVDLLRGADGELALRIGESEPFGVINVGDAPALKQLCEDNGLDVKDRVFSGTMFGTINEAGSKINLLIGSKKFSEGWNSFRVSTMGLLNVGKTEGPQIIQLFGRGVRLRGLNGSLKRSAHIPGIDAPKHLRLLETLNVFGVHADYMRQFREYLEEEGVPTGGEALEFLLPVLPNLSFAKLKTLALDQAVDFDRDIEPFVITANPPEAIQRMPVRLNWYPKLEALSSAGLSVKPPAFTLQRTTLTEESLAFVDYKTLQWELDRYKAERGYHKLIVPGEILEDLIIVPSWYVLLAPPEDFTMDAMWKTNRIQEVVTALLKRYVDRFYKTTRDAWERDHLQLVKVGDADANLAVTHRFLVEASNEFLIEKLKDLEKLVRSGEIRDLTFQSLHGIIFGRHLYKPLIHLDQAGITVSPVALNVGERDFILDLRTFYDANKPFFDGKELYVLRNLSRGKGIGFFEAGNFYPDFILWLVDGDVQHVVFVDPKGIARLEEDHPKIRFHETVKELEHRFAGESVTFDSFIVSVTPFSTLAPRTDMTREQFAARHVLFQTEDKQSYVRRILETALASQPKPQQGELQ